MRTSAALSVSKAKNTAAETVHRNPHLRIAKALLLPVPHLLHATDPRSLFRTPLPEVTPELTEDRTTCHRRLLEDGTDAHATHRTGVTRTVLHRTLRHTRLGDPTVLHRRAIPLEELRHRHPTVFRIGITRLRIIRTQRRGDTGWAHLHPTIVTVYTNTKNPHDPPIPTILGIHTVRLHRDPGAATDRRRRNNHKHNPHRQTPTVLAITVHHHHRNTCRTDRHPLRLPNSTDHKVDGIRAPGRRQHPRAVFTEKWICPT